LLVLSFIKSGVSIFVKSTTVGVNINKTSFVTSTLFSVEKRNGKIEPKIGTEFSTFCVVVFFNPPSIIDSPSFTTTMFSSIWPTSIGRKSFPPLARFVSFARHSF